MAYIALYRKYRSQNFEELMGQDQVTTTLQNAIRTGRIAHAYLFHGARGCGKTSTARLLSRALNCVAQDGPTPTPCGVCRLCVSIRENTCMDVVEIDAASETGVDNVREKIIENVQYASSEARYKVYIIDEVHDLSSKAFDALLKTLEEPPPHVVFILATTEYHKVPITIRSRCQGYQFKRGSIHDLSAAVERVIKAEGFTAEPEAVQAVARSAEGSWRDALSILEQVLAYCDGHITADVVHRALGTVGTEMLVRVTETLARGAWDETLGIASDLVDSGTDVKQLLTALAGHLRDLMLLASGAKQAAAQELGADRLALLKPQTTLFAPATLLDMMGELSAAERELRFNNQHRWILERTLLRLMLIGQGAYGAQEQPQAVVRPQSGATPTVTRQTPRPPVNDSGRTRKFSNDTDDTEDSTPNTQTSRRKFDFSDEDVAEDNPHSTAPPAPSVVPRPPTQQAAQTFAVNTNAPAATGPMDEADDADEDENDETEETLEVGEDAFIAPTAPFLTAADTYAPATNAPNAAASNGFGSVPTETAANGASVPASPPDASKYKFADDITLEVIQRSWDRIVKSVIKVSPAGGGYLEKAQVIALDAKTVILSFKDAFARDRIQSKAKDLVEKKINEGLKTEGYRISCLLEGQYGSDGQNGAGGAGGAVKPPPSPPSNGSGAAPVMEMQTLLDAPATLTAPSGPSRVMDFEVPTAVPPTAAHDRAPANGAAMHGAAANGAPASPSLVVENAASSTARVNPPAPPTPPGKGMLEEALDIFGGKVISTEHA